MKPPTAASYHVEQLEQVRSVCLYVSTKEEGYREITARLREAGFGPDSNEAGNLVRQRWKHPSAAHATVEFLIPPLRPDQRGGTLQSLEKDFAAVVAPGVDLAFRDRRVVTLSGTTLMGEPVGDASRDAGR